MAIPFDKSSSLPGTRTPISDSQLVRTRLPSCPLIPGREPLSFSRKRRSSVPSAEAANTTPRQVKRRRPPGRSEEGTVKTSYPLLPPGLPSRGRTSTTLVSANTWAPRFSARRSEEHTSELQSLRHLVCRLLLGTQKHTSEFQSLRHLVCRLLLKSGEPTTA